MRPKWRQFSSRQKAFLATYELVERASNFFSRKDETRNKTRRCTNASIVCHILIFRTHTNEGEATRLAELALIFIPIYNVALSAKLPSLPILSFNFALCFISVLSNYYCVHVHMNVHTFIHVQYYVYFYQIKVVLIFFSSFVLCFKNIVYS